MNKIPSLRFKEFSGEWEEKILNSIFERITEKNKENNDNVLTISAQYGLISQTDFFNKSVAGKDLTKYYLLHKDDFAYNKSYSNGYPMGAIKRLTKYDKGIVSTLYICFRVKNNDNVSFLEQFFESKKIEKSIQDIAQEGARNHGLLNISVGDFFDITINLPCLEEQEKIANFLSSVGKKISIAEEKLNLFKKYKKGIMQKIFSQKLRFKDKNGNNYPEWEEKKLGEIFSFKQGYQIPFSEQIKTKEKGYIRYLYISDFLSDKNLLYVKDDGKEKISETDIIVANTGNTAGTFYRGKSGILSNNMFSIQNNEKVVTNNFLFQFLGSSLYSSQLKTFFNSSGQPHLGHKNMSMIMINYPVFLEEQQKIADFLSAIDDKIENISDNLENLKLFKKSMLQKMFV